MARKRRDRNQNMDMEIGRGIPDDVMGGLPPMPDLPTDGNKSIEGGDISNIVKERLSRLESKPLIPSKFELEAESTKLESIVKPVEEIIKTGEPIDDNLLIKEDDRVSIKEVSDILSFSPEIKKPEFNIIPSDILNDRDRAKLFAEEDARRRIEDERFEQFNQSLEEEYERRRLFEDEIRIMKEEFDIYLKKTFPEFVGDRKMKESEITEMTRKSEDERRRNENRRKDLQTKKIQRMESEKKRKLKEKQFQLNKLTKNEVTTFFEEEILIEQREKLSKHSELEGLNDVQKTIRAVREMEIRMGRPIIPHRDIVESEESDFDRESYTNSSDILIKPKEGPSPIEEEMKRKMLEELRFRVNSKEDMGEDYISKDR